MINVGFMLNFPIEYKGGINYLKNLFYAIQQCKDTEVRVVLFVPDNMDDEYVTIFSPHAKIIRTKILKRKSFPWLLSRIGEKYFKYDPLAYFLLKRNNIRCISHSNYVCPDKKIKTINWIPDFQYLHFPDFWTSKQLSETSKLHKYLIKGSDKIVLSSYDAFNDFKTRYGNMSQKVEVIHFVSQPPANHADVSQQVSNVYKTNDLPYFYLPNQFWTHKNHIAVFKACEILVRKGYNFQLLTSGHMKDFRGNDDHISHLIDYVKENNLENVIKFLGLISYTDVFDLITNATALVNPSYFEGWSSTVEEAKSVGTLTLLSNIPVHKEQNPSGARFFNPDSPVELAKIMEDVLINKIPFVKASPKVLKEQLDNRTKIFGQKYIDLVKNLTLPANAKRNSR
jgi:glycosyltransferase involved in cell wall biosynthesis